jgi:hypothetical protein
MSLVRVEQAQEELKAKQAQVSIKDWKPGELCTPTHYVRCPTCKKVWNTKNTAGMCCGFSIKGDSMQCVYLHELPLDTQKEIEKEQLKQFNIQRNEEKYKETSAIQEKPAEQMGKTEGVRAGTTGGGGGSSSHEAARGCEGSIEFTVKKDVEKAKTLLQQATENVAKVIVEFKEKCLMELCCKLWGCEPDKVLEEANEHSLKIVFSQQSREVENVWIDGSLQGRFVINQGSLTGAITFYDHKNVAKSRSF